MPAHTAQSPEFIASVQEANARRIAAQEQRTSTASRSAADRQSRSTQAVPYRHADQAQEGISPQRQPQCTVFHNPK